MKRILLFISLSFSILSSFSQDIRKWSNDQIAFSPSINIYSSHPKIEVDNDTIIVRGTRYNLSTQWFQIVKYSLDGNLISFVEYGKGSNSENKILQYYTDKNEQLYLLQAEPIDSVIHQLKVQKYSVSGGLIWEKQIPNVLIFGNESLTFVNDSSFVILANKMTSINEYVCNIYAYKTTGELMWEKEIKSTPNGNDIFIRTIIGRGSGEDRDIYCIGDSFISCDLHYFWIKISSDLKISISELFDVNYSPVNLYLSKDNNLFLTCNAGYELDKFSFDGEQIWSVDYGSFLPDNASGDNISCVTEDKDGNVYITGMHFGKGFDTPEFSHSDILTIKYDINGNFLWENRYQYGVNNKDVGNSLSFNNEYVYVGGYSQNNGLHHDKDFLVLKLDRQTGKNKGTYRYHAFPEGDNVVTDIYAFEDGTVALTGLTKQGNGLHWTTQLLTDVRTNILEIKSISDVKAFPNPLISGEILTIKASGINNYRLVSIDGMLILSGKIDSANNNQILINNLKPGVYILYLDNEKNKTKILVK